MSHDGENSGKLVPAFPAVDHCSVDFLIQKVEELQETDRLYTLERVIDDNYALQKRILIYRKLWYLWTDILEALYGSLPRLWHALEGFVEGNVEGNVAIEGVRLAKGEDCMGRLGLRHEGWV